MFQIIILPDNVNSKSSNFGAPVPLCDDNGEEVIFANMKLAADYANEIASRPPNDLRYGPNPAYAVVDTVIFESIKFRRGHPDYYDWRRWREYCMHSDDDNVTSPCMQCDGCAKYMSLMEREFITVNSYYYRIQTW